MSQKLTLSIVTPEKLLVSEEVDQVNAPGTEGDLGILYDHAPILTNLRSGQMSYENDGETISLVVSGGYLEVTDNRVTVLAETGEFLHEIDRERAERAHAHAEKQLSQTDLSEEEFIKAQKKLFRATARLENIEKN
ncbi:MAG: F0F1 ATP synthase subunit epsilon [Nitrospina sp.]|jgi:F-type H+-transporting ATPase subunit epsilon|nr:F0F1 ATP synthase subunit epsilon [Nitrospina sp.]MBT3508175.1 F0F1 ATP synthase subunit epsilon [Nitrospina sp.]MBT3874846.1 F0F1 ATP synthase subunit epsilon [Nitrospina sp.]MBT4047992.1 F0F1 ATP synthase subunit epsilon [Nitrospina sp.]MBT4555951.1 F0F1 ATP synthase subunit epsilon [Nitrospina sp.]